MEVIDYAGNGVLSRGYGKPEIFNTDQGSQFTSIAAATPGCSITMAEIYLAAANQTNRASSDGNGGKSFGAANDNTFAHIPQITTASI